MSLHASIENTTIASEGQAASLQMTAGSLASMPGRGVVRGVALWLFGDNHGPRRRSDRCEQRGIS